LFTLDKIKKPEWETVDIWFNYLMISNTYKIGCSIPELAYQIYGKSVIENRYKGISNEFKYKPSVFQISYNEDLNRIYIFCPIKKLVKINIYTWNHQTNDIKIIFHKIKEFNNNVIWFQPNAFIMKYGGAKISILDNDDNILTEEYMIYRDF
jgi:hypothetical protein